MSRRISGGRRSRRHRARPASRASRAHGRRPSSPGRVGAALLLLAAVVVPALPAHAAEVTYEVTGTVTEAPDIAGFPSPGDRWTMRYTVDDTTTDTSTADYLGFYDGAVTSLSLTVGDYATSLRAETRGWVRVTDETGSLSYDQYEASSGVTYDSESGTTVGHLSGDAIAGYEPWITSIDLRAQTDVLYDDSLVTDVTVLQQMLLSVPNNCSTGGCDFFSLGFVDPDTDTSVVVRGDVDSIVLATPDGDTAAPTWPSDASLTITDVTATSATLTWTAATDDTGVDGYEVFRDGARIGTTAAATRTFADDGLVPDTTYTYRVEAFDAAENLSSDGPTATATTSTTVTIGVVEQVAVSDQPDLRVLTPVVISIDESIGVRDDVDLIPSPVIALQETIGVSDSTGVQHADDGDGIAAPIDGYWDGEFIDLSDVASDDFTDIHLGGNTFGEILDRAGLTVTVEDADGDGGVDLGVSGTPVDNDAVFQACALPETVVEAPWGAAGTLTCGSITLTVTAGEMTMWPRLDGRIGEVAVLVRAGASVTIAQGDDGGLAISSDVASTTVATLTVGEVVVPLRPGDRLLLAAGGCLGDLDGDGTVTAADLSRVSRAMPSTPGVARWDPSADVDRDGDVDRVDQRLVLHAFLDADCGPLGEVAVVRHAPAAVLTSPADRRRRQRCR